MVVSVPDSVLVELQTYVGFGPADAEALRGMYSHAHPHFTRIAEVFYERILDHSEARRVLEGGESQVGELKRALVRWMEGLFLGPWDQDYFERRCRIGRVHVRVGLPQHYMLGP